LASCPHSKLCITNLGLLSGIEKGELGAV